MFHRPQARMSEQTAPRRVTRPAFRKAASGSRCVLVYVANLANRSKGVRMHRGIDGKLWHSAR